MGLHAILSGDASVVVAGGMESMTVLRTLSICARVHKYGAAGMKDHMATDGLEDAYAGGAMGNFADMIAKEYQFTRKQQDDYALETLSRAQAATKKAASSGDLADHRQIKKRRHRARRGPNCRATRPAGEDPGAEAGVLEGRRGPPRRQRLGDFRTARPRRGGSNGQGRSQEARAEAARPGSPAGGAQTMSRRTSRPAPVPAMQKALEKAGWKASGDVDLWEIQRSVRRVVPVIAMKELGITHDEDQRERQRLCAGPPIGASGARVVVALINAMEQKGAKKGMAALCIGGSEGIAMATGVTAWPTDGDKDDRLHRGQSPRARSCAVRSVWAQVRPSSPPMAGAIIRGAPLEHVEEQAAGEAAGCPRIPIGRGGEKLLRQRNTSP